MNKRVQLIVSFSVLVVLVFGLYFFTDWFSKVTGYFSGESELESLANCLNENGAQFFSSFYCSECERQKDLFGKDFRIIEEIGCGGRGEECNNLRSVPAWYLNKTIVYGYQDVESLRKISGCVD